MDFYTYVVGDKKRLNLKNLGTSYIRCETNEKETYHGRIRHDNSLFLIESGTMEIRNIDIERKVLELNLEEKTKNILEEIEDYCKNSLNELNKKHNIVEETNNEEFLTRIFKSNIKQDENNFYMKISVKDGITSLSLSSDNLDDDGKEINFENLQKGDKVRLILEIRSVNIIPKGEIAFLEIICQALDVEKSSDEEINNSKKINVSFKNKKVFTKSKVIELDTSNVVSEAPPKVTGKKNTKSKNL